MIWDSQDLTNRVGEEDSPAALFKNEQLDQSIALLEERLRQGEEERAKQGLDREAKSVFLEKGGEQAYKRFDKFVKEDPGFGHRHDKSKMTFKSSHISHVQAVVN